VWLYESNTQRLIQLFLKMGVDPNATDRKGKTPLHILAEKWNWTRFSTYLDSADFPSESLSNVFQSLVEAGGHLDQATPEGHTVIDFLEIQRKKHSLHDYYFNSYLNSLINTVLPLSCYCAQSLRQHKIPLGNQLPPRVHSFILRHSALKR
jgi:ankyrin repeat protein